MSSAENKKYLTYRKTLDLCNYLNNLMSLRQHYKNKFVIKKAIKPLNFREASMISDSVILKISM